MGLTFLHPDTNDSDFLCPIQILKHMRHLHYVHVGCCYWSYTDSRIFSIFQYQPLRKYHPIAKTVSPVRAELRFRVYRSRCLGIKSALVCFCATDSL
jgi:hypothetical protein